MEARTTIKEMIAGNAIYVPDYQRAYSWDTGKDGSIKSQVNVFYADIMDYLRSGSKTPYYFGHFLYEKTTSDNNYGIIDGQQRLTTITIFLSAIFRTIASRRELTEEEQIYKEDIIIRRSSYKFRTVQYDNQLFRDYVIDDNKTDHHGIETESGKRIVAAYDYFVSKLNEIDNSKIVQILHAVANASCSTYQVANEAEAIQMFIFQNNRGKRPSQLEVIKALFMYNLHLYAKDETDVLIEEVKNRFEKIYKSISTIEDFVDEDAVLLYSLKVFCNSLWEGSPLEKVNSELEKENRLQFIREFTLCLDKSFNSLAALERDSNGDINIQSSLLCGHYDIVLPFFIKAYTLGFSKENISKMAKSLGDIVLRDAIIGTRANLVSRLNDKFIHLEESLDRLIELIDWMKITQDWWWQHWNNTNLLNILNGGLGRNAHSVCKILLWRYENYLIQNEGKGGYSALRYDDIAQPHLEHISPQTNPGETVANGYDEYDEEFINNYLYSIGNFLLLSAPHNESIGNRPFEQKRATYTQLRQQVEIQTMTEHDHVWNREKIAQRKNKIIDFIINNI